MAKRKKVKSKAGVTIGWNIIDHEGVVQQNGVKTLQRH